LLQGVDQVKYRDRTPSTYVEYLPGIFAMIAQYIPHVKFKVESMLDIDEVIASLKAAQEQA